MELRGDAGSRPRVVTRDFRIGRAFGVDIVAAPSLLVLVVLLTWSLWVDLQVQNPGSSFGSVTLGAVVAGVLFFASVVIHELSHSVVAMRRGIQVKRIRLFVFGGVSEIESEATSARDEFVIAAVGPASSLVLAGVFAGIVWVLPGSWAVAERAFGILAVANLMLGLFNLLPGLPLDGGRVLRSIVWRSRNDRAAATRIATGAGRLLGLILVGIGAFVSLRSSAGVLGGLWYIAVGWFLSSAAMATQARENILARIAGKTTGDIMRRVADAVPAELTVARLVELYQMGPKLRDQVVEMDGRVRGVIGQVEVEAVASTDRGTTTVGSAMTRITADDVVEASAPIEELLARPAGRSRRVVVVADGRVVGLVTPRELAGALAA